MRPGRAPWQRAGKLRYHFAARCQAGIGVNQEVSMRLSEAHKGKRGARPAVRAKTSNGHSNEISSPDRVVESIIGGIRAGRYVPGQRLVEADLTAGLKVSRGPVREALKRLAAEGVITLTRHRGAYIRALMRDEADQMLVVLEMLTGLIARLAAETVNIGGNADRLREAFEHLNAFREIEGGMAFVDERRHFYDTLLEIGGNVQLARMMPMMQIHLLRLQFRSYVSAREREEQFEDYAAITKAVLKGNPRLAERIMRLHIRKMRRAVARMPDTAFAIGA